MSGVGGVFVDTSALLALIFSDDRKHAWAREVFEMLAVDDAVLISSSYVWVETYALLQRRVGLAAVMIVRDEIAPLIEVVWVDRSIHEAGLERVLQAQQRKLSLVDCTSFEIMRRQGLHRAFACDGHFEAEGFELLNP